MAKNGWLPVGSPPVTPCPGAAAHEAFPCRRRRCIFSSMSINEILLPEFDQEMAATRRLLERVPQADAGCRPHPTSYSLGDLAVHDSRLPLPSLYGPTADTR
jgi:hypothetical protein